MIVDQSKSHLTEGLLSMLAKQHIRVVRSDLTRDDTYPEESSLMIFLGLARE